MKMYLKRPIHPSWMIAIACLGVFVGVVVAPIFDWRWVTHTSWLIVGISLVLSACIYKRAVWILLAIVGGIIIGLWRGTVTDAALTAYQPLIDRTLTIAGVVQEDADTDKHGNIVVRLRDISYNGNSLPGTMWVSLDTKSSPIQRSDKVSVHGELQEGFGTFAAVMYRAQIEKIERPKPGDIALMVRNWFSEAVRSVIPEPESSLGVGYLVGQRRGLPEELDSALQVAGLTHVVVASGYNLTILVRFSRRIFVRVSKYLAALTSGSLILAFMAVTGMSPSMSRAGLVAGLSLLAWYYGRKFHPIVLLLIAAAATVLVNPSYAWGDVGWQLSFAAFAGVMILAPLLQVFYFGDKKPGTVRQILGETIAATIMTLPILLLTFGFMSNVAVVANLLILPLVPLAMLLTFIAGIGALALPFAGEIIALPAQLLLSYMSQTAQFFASLPWAKNEFDVTPLIAVFMYVLLGVFMIYMKWRTKLNLRDTSIIE